MKEPKYKKSAFSMVELVVALAVLLILSAILINSIQSIRQNAIAVESISRLRTLGTAFSLYAMEHNNQFPTSGTGVDSSGTPPPSPATKRWHVKLLPYIDGTPKYGDPGVTLTDIGTLKLFKSPFAENTNSAVGIYGYNINLTDEFNPVYTYNLRNPSKFILLASLGGLNESGNHQGGLHLTTSSPHIMARRYGWTGPVSGNGASPNYNGKTAFLFADGRTDLREVLAPNEWPWKDPASAFDPD